MATNLEAILQKASIDYHMWQPDAGTFEILLMSRSGKGIVDIKVFRDKNNRWRVQSEVAEWLEAEILQSVAEPESRGTVKAEKKQAGGKKATKAAVKKVGKKVPKKKTNNQRRPRSK